MAATEKKKYRNNYLNKVILQLRFAKNQSIEIQNIKKYKDMLGDAYSELSSITQKGIIIQNEGGRIQTGVDNVMIWQIKSSDLSHTINITNESIDISFTKYETFRQYMEIVSKAMGQFFEVVTDIKLINRLGLRYINEIKLEPGNINWEEFISPVLVKSFEFIDSKKLRRLMHNMVIEHDDETLINMNYGQFNRYFPAPIADNEFILDLDAHTTTAIRPSEWAQYVESFNKSIAIYFELSITNKLRDKMEVIDEPEQKTQG